MNGCTIPYTPIAVDFWKVRQLQRVRLFFLSHAHLHPACGITSSWSMPIYCSPVSKKILLQRFQLNQDVVHALELNIPHVIPMTSNEDVTMTVTLIDANHCPGSVMFLFEGYFGRILYTGDFRYTEEMLTTSPFSSVIERPIDVLYMDNTYCSPKCSFPTREVAEQEIITTIEQFQKEKVVIGLRNLGKEDLLSTIASRLNVTIKVSDERYKTLELLGTHEHFSTSDSNCRIEVVQMVDITRQNMDTWNKEKPTVAILPTAIFTALGDFPFHGQRDMIVVPYSDHSSYAELHRFVAAVKPKSIIPIVKADVRDPLNAALLDRTSVECFLEYLDKTPMTNYHIPPSVLEFMNQTPSRGSNRRANGGRKTSLKAKAPRTNARNRKNNENISCANGSCASTPFEHKSKKLVEVNNSTVSCGKDIVLETPKADTFSSRDSQDMDFQECSSSLTKSHRFGSKLSRCASIDRLCSSYHRPHIKLRLNRVSSPDLRMHLKRKIRVDARHPSPGLHSNLVRTRRVRLCNAHLCRTLCHSSKHCKSFMSDGFDRTSSPRDSILESRAGFSIGVFESTKENVSNRQTTVPPNSTDAIDLSGKGHDASEHLNKCTILMSSSPVQDDLRERSLDLGKRKESEEFVITSSGLSLLAVSGSDTCNVTDSRTSPRTSSTCVPSSLVQQPRDLYHEFSQKGGEQVLKQFPDSEDKMSWVSSYRDLVSGNVSSDIPATYCSSYICDQVPQGPNLKINSVPSELSNIRLGRRDHRDFESVLSNSSTLTADLLNDKSSTLFEYDPTAYDSFVIKLDEARKITVGQSAMTWRGGHHHYSLPVSFGVKDNFNFEQRSPDVFCSNGNDSFVAKRQKLDLSSSPSTDDSNKFEIDKDEPNVQFNQNFKMALHTANAISESALPPKKNWRQRFGMAQLHKVHPENKWGKIEPNGVSKLLIASGTSENSKDFSRL